MFKALSDNELDFLSQLTQGLFDALAGTSCRCLISGEFGVYLLDSSRRDRVSIQINYNEGFFDNKLLVCTFSMSPDKKTVSEPQGGVQYIYDFGDVMTEEITTIGKLCKDRKMFMGLKDGRDLFVEKHYYIKQDNQEIIIGEITSVLHEMSPLLGLIDGNPRHMPEREVGQAR